MGPAYDPETQKQSYPDARVSPDRTRVDNTTAQTDKGPRHPEDEITQRRQPAPFPDMAHYDEPSYREHVSGGLVWDPTEAPRFQPVYPTYPDRYQQPTQSYPVPTTPAQNYAPAYQPGYGYPGAGYANRPPANNYAQPYPYPYPNYRGPYGYAPYPYNWRPSKPPRDGYLLGISIAAFICSMLVLLGGFVCALLLALVVLSPADSGLSSGKDTFSLIVLFLALSIACLVGGSFSLYHSMRALFFQKASRPFKLPMFWLFLAFYILVAAIGAALDAKNAPISNIPFTVFLIGLSGLLPALTILAVGMRRAGNPKQRIWPTTWRRFTLSIVSGATLAILLASIFELILSFFVGRDLGISGFSIDNPSQAMLHDPRVITFMIILLSVIAPLVEEGVKPLAVIALIGRVRSAAEAFILGLACGIGFDLIETSGYISQGYQDWLKVAIERSPAGLLHGFGAGMIALGWYYLTHRQSTQHRFLRGFGCILYAILQHGIWNGTFVLALLPAPYGPFFDHGIVPLGPLSFGGDILPYLVLSLLMVTFFIYVSGKLRASVNPVRPIKPQPQAYQYRQSVPARV